MSITRGRDLERARLKQDRRELSNALIEAHKMAGALRRNYQRFGIWPDDLEAVWAYIDDVCERIAVHEADHENTEAA